MKKALSALIALVMILALAACGGDYTTIDTSTPEGLAEKYVGAVIAGDGETIFNLTIDKYEVARRIESGFVSDEAEYIADCIEEAQEKVSENEEEYGENLSFSDFEIEEQHIYNEEETALLVKYLEEGKTYPEGSVSDIQTLKVSFKVKGSEKESTLHYEQSIAKIDGQWYWGITNINATHDGVLKFIKELKGE